MSIRSHSIARSLSELLAVLLLIATPLSAADPLKELWLKVDESAKQDQPRTAIELLDRIQVEARQRNSWPDLAKAIILRLDATAAIEGNPQSAFNALHDEILKAPPALKPLLRVVQARWAYGYLIRHSHGHATRTDSATDDGTDITTWSPQRVRREVDRCLQEALADADALGKIPIATFGSLLSGTELGDSYRPTLLDFIARQALAFYATLEPDSPNAGRSLRITAEGPALGGCDEFLAWKPVCDEATLPTLRALRIHQLLLEFHRKDAERSAFLHSDLERLRWASSLVTGKRKHQRVEAALRSFISAHADHPLCADASQDLANLLVRLERRKEARDVAARAAKAFAEHPFGKLCQAIVDQLESPQLTVIHESAWTPAGAGMQVQYRNLQQIHLRAYARPWSVDNETLDEDPGPEGDNEQEVLKSVHKLLKGKPDIAWNLPLEDDGDLKDREVELVAPENLDPGYYWIVASADESFATSDNILQIGKVHVTRLAMTARESDDGGVEGKVVDPVSGGPLADIEVTLAMENQRGNGIRKASTTTAEDGSFHFKGEIDEDVLLVAGKGRDRAITRISTYQDANRDPGVLDQLLVMTDRAVYRPGQTIHFKGIWCRIHESAGKYGTVQGETTTVVLRDSHEREIASLKVTTNALGSFCGSFTAPGDSLLGGFTIGNDDGRCSLRVEQYKRPKFSCTILKPQGETSLGRDLTVTVQALGYNGSPADGAKVSWQVTRRTMPSDSPWWLMNLPMLDPVSEIIANGEGSTDAAGQCPITFNAKADPENEPGQQLIHYYQVDAVITDSNGETREATCSVSVGSPSLSAGLSCDEWLFAGQAARLHIETHSLEGHPVTSKGVVRIHRLKTPDHCARPSAFSWNESGAQRQSDPRDPDTWPVGELISETPYQTSSTEADKGRAELPFTLPAGNYRATLTTADAAGVAVETSLCFQVFDPTASKATSPIPFQLIHSESTIEPGQVFTVLWASGYAEARACVEWFKDGTLLKREWSTPGRTQQSFAWQATEHLRGGFNVRVTQLTQNTPECGELTIRVPWTPKRLGLKWEHFTSRLTPGAQETWTAVVTDPQGQAAAAEMIATLYDASLDAYERHALPDPTDLLRAEGNSGRVADDEFSNSYETAENFGRWTHPPPQPSFDRPFHRRFLIQFISDYEDPFADHHSHGLRCGSVLDFNAIDQLMTGNVLGMSGLMTDGAAAGGGGYEQTLSSMLAPACPSAFGCDQIVTAGNRSGDYAISTNTIDAILNNPQRAGIDGQAALQAFVAPRRNLNETACFLPQLQSDAEGRLRITFTVPQSLTTWRFLGLVHDAALRSAMLEGSAVGSLDLMVQPNPPRFLREGDLLEFPVKITNRSDRAQSGQASLDLSDARTDENRSEALGISAASQPFELAAGQSCTLIWHLRIPDGAGVLKYKALAGNERVSDGEEGWLPILPRRILVRDSMCLPIRDAGERSVRFEALARGTADPSIESVGLEVEVVSQPVWNALLAMPYLLEFPHECAEQTFHRYYANALSSHLIQSQPQIRETLEAWRKGTPPPDPLAAHQELTGILLEQTPWLRDAEDPDATRHRLARLLDKARMDDESRQALLKLDSMRGADGLYPWFAGGAGSPHISLVIATGIARLRAMGVECDPEPALKAIEALDRIFLRDYQRILAEGTREDKHLDPITAHYLYTRSFFLKDRKPDGKQQAAIDFFLDQASRHWTRLDGRMARAQAAIALHRAGRHDSATLITRSLKEHSLSKPDEGLHWQDEQSGGWWLSPIETQAMMIEAFHEIDRDELAVRDCRIWLLRQKQTRDWGSTSATADAIHALLLGDNPTATDSAPLQVRLGTQEIQPAATTPAAAANFSVRLDPARIQPEWAGITLRKQDAGIAWASIHWQSLQDIGSLPAAGSERLKLDKQLCVRRQTPTGPVLTPVDGPLKVGDQLVSRLVITNSVAMDYIHLRDLRGSGTEPGIDLSGQRWQDGLAFYETTHDTARHFFFEHLPAGTHVIESAVRLQHAGAYQCGVAEIQCLVAPEFSARSSSTKIEVTR